MSQKMLLLWIIICCRLSVKVFAVSRNSTIAMQRSADAFFGGSNTIDRQFPGDPSLIVPQMIVGVLLPIAIIIGIGVVLMKIFIIGFLLLGRGGYGVGQGVGAGYYPWRADQPQQQTARSLLGKNGSIIPPFLSSTLLSLVDKVTNAMENFEKNKI